MRYLRTFATAACTVVVVVAAPAAAQDPGVHIDPDSPTAKEYALPFENERRLADPSTPSDAAITPGQRDSPAFGVGLAPAGSSDGPAAGKSSVGIASGRSAASGTAGGESAGSDADRAAAATVRAATANPGAPGGDVGDTLVIAGAALAVLVLGAGAGLVLRRRRA